MTILVPVLRRLSWTVSLVFLFAVTTAHSQDIPFLSAHTSKGFNSTATQVAVNKAIWISQDDTKLEVFESTFIDGSWVQKSIYSILCDCSTAYFDGGYNGNYLSHNRVQLLQFYDRGLQHDRYLLFGLDGQGNWHINDILNENSDFPVREFFSIDNLAFVRFVVYGADDDPVRDDRIWEISDSGVWSQIELADLPSQFVTHVTEPISYCCLSGEGDNFILKPSNTNRVLHFDKRNSTEWQTRTIDLPGRPIVNWSSDRDWILLKGNALMVVEAFSDNDLPEQGRVNLYFLAANGQWNLEATVDLIDATPPTSNLLFNENTALIDNRIYQRTGNGNWTIVAGINTDQQVIEAFIADDMLSWSSLQNGRLNIDISDWVSPLVCSEVNSNGQGSLLNSPCALRPAARVAQPRGRLLPLHLAGTEAPLAIDRETSSSRDVSFFSIGGRYVDDRSGLFDDDLHLFNWVVQGAELTRTSVANPVPGSRISHVSENAGQVLVHSLDWPDGTLHLLADAEQGALNGERIRVEGVASSYLTPYSPAAMALDGDQAAMVAQFRSDTTSGLGLFSLDMSSSQNNFSMVYEIDSNNLFSGEEEVSISQGRIALAVRGKVHIMTMTNNGNLQYDATVKPDVVSTEYVTHKLDGDTLIVGGFDLVSNDPYFRVDIAALWQQSSTGEWVLAQRFEQQVASDGRFGKQVFLSGDSAVVMSLRQEPSREPNAVGNMVIEPNYQIYKKLENGSWQFKKRIEHTSGYEMDCADCDFYSDIRWPARLFGQYLFLPVRNDTGLHYRVYDTTTDSTGFIATSDPLDETATQSGDSTTGVSNGTQATDSDMPVIDDSTAGSTGGTPVEDNGANGDPLSIDDNGATSNNASSGGGGGMGLPLLFALLLARKTREAGAVFVARFFSNRARTILT